MADRRALVANASSAKQTRKAAAFERQQHRQFLIDLAEWFSTPAGIRIACTMLERWSAWTSVFASDPLAMAHRAGKQDVAHEIMRWADEATDDALARINAEHMRRAREVANIGGHVDADTEQDEPLEDSDG